MSARELIVLGTASQAPTRHRAHNSYALRWDDQLILFDPGEGTQRQAILADVAIARATGVCITHFHGDHCLGLPGVIQRRALDARSTPDGLPPLPVFFPADGEVYFERMRGASIFHDTSGIEPQPIGDAGPVGRLGDLTLTAIGLEHRVTTFGYRLQEPPRRRFDPARLAEFGIEGPAVGQLSRAGHLDLADGRRVSLDDVSDVRPGQSMAFIMDTRPCDGARELADGVDLLVCESTYLDTELELAHRYHHMTARQAGRLADEAGARRLVLTHFSARHPENDAFRREASEEHDDVVTAEDLAVIPVPSART